MNKLSVVGAPCLHDIISRILANLLVLKYQDLHPLFEAKSIQICKVEGNSAFLLGLTPYGYCWFKIRHLHLYKCSIWRLHSALNLWFLYSYYL